MNPGNEDAPSVGGEAALIERAKAGDPGAFEEIFTAYRGHVYSLSYRMTGNAHDAEDLCQDVFLKAFRKIGSFRGQSSFSTWLYRVTMNSSKDVLRKKKRRPDIPGEDGGEAASSLYEGRDSAMESGPEREALAAEKRLLVETALSQLPVKLRAPLVLYELEGLEYRKVAQLLKIPVGTVKSRIFRARLQLAEILEPYKEHWLG